MITVNVTQAHIDAGVRSTSDRCPIALALLEAQGGGFASVGLGECALAPAGSPGITTRYQLPAAAMHFIRRFDTGAAVEPLTFVLRKELPVGELWNDPWWKDAPYA